MSFAKGTEFDASRMQRLAAAVPVTYTVFLDGSTYRAETHLQGGTDYSDAKAQVVIQAALDAIANTGGRVHIKQQTGGNYYEIDDKITIPSKAAGAIYYWITSDGAELDFLNTVADNGFELDHTTARTNFLFMSGMQIQMNKQDATYHAIYINNANDLHFHDLKCAYGDIKITNAGRVWMDDVTVVDSPNAGIYLDTVQYGQFDNIYLDNCGGYGGHAGHNAFDINTTAGQISISNTRIYGGKGAFGGQAYGLCIDLISDLAINNLTCDGFKNSPIFIAGGNFMTLNNILVENSDTYGLCLYSTNADLKNVTLNNFVIKDCYGTGVYVRSESGNDVYRVEIGNGVIDTIADDGSAYRGLTITDDTGGGTCTYINVHDVHVENCNRAFVEGASSDYNRFWGITYTNCNLRPTFVGSHSKFPTITTPFAVGGAGAAVRATPYGMEVDAAGEYALAMVTLPKDLHAILQIIVNAISIVAEADAMHAEFVINGAGLNEGHNTHNIALTDFNSDTTNFGANDAIRWVITDSDDADVAALAAEDTLEIVALYEAAGGADCATDAAFRDVWIKYI